MLCKSYCFAVDTACLWTLLCCGHCFATAVDTVLLWTLLCRGRCFAVGTALPWKLLCCERTYLLWTLLAVQHCFAADTAALLWTLLCCGHCFAVDTACCGHCTACPSILMIFFLHPAYLLLAACFGFCLLCTLLCCILAGCCLLWILLTLYTALLYADTVVLGGCLQASRENNVRMFRDMREAADSVDPSRDTYAYSDK